MVFIALSKSPRARFRVVQLSLKGKCTVLALLALLTSWKMRFLSGKEPAGKYSSPKRAVFRAKPGTWEAVLGFIGTDHLRILPCLFRLSLRPTRLGLKISYSMALIVW